MIEKAEFAGHVVGEVVARGRGRAVRYRGELRI